MLSGSTELIISESNGIPIGVDGGPPEAAFVLPIRHLRRFQLGSCIGGDSQRVDLDRYGCLQFSLQRGDAAFPNSDTNMRASVG